MDIGTAEILTVNGVGGNDTLTVDFVDGNAIPTGGVSFNGNDPVAGPGDKLVLEKSTSSGLFNTITYTFVSNSNGDIALDPDGAGATPASTITYTGLEPVIDNLDAANRIFTFNAGAETITLSDIVDAGGTQMRIDSDVGGETVDFANPTTSLTINAGSGADTINITGRDSAFAGSLVVNGDADSDTLVGPNVPSTWNLTGANTGNIAGLVNSFTTTENLTGGSDADSFIFATGGSVSGAINGGDGTDTLDYSAYTTQVAVNLGLGSTGLAANLDGARKCRSATTTATGTATITNYNAVTKTFDIAVTVSNLDPANVTGFHIHRAPFGVNGPIIIDFMGAGALWSPPARASRSPPPAYRSRPRSWAAPPTRRRSWAASPTSISTRHLPRRRNPRPGLHRMPTST